MRPTACNRASRSWTLVGDVKPLSFMLVAGEPSGDQLAAELVMALRRAAGPAPVSFFGAGGERMAAAGVELAFDLTRHSVIGIPSWAEVRRFLRFRDQLVAMANERLPDAVIGVDFFAFNGRLAETMRRSLPTGPFHNWRPKLIQDVSPPVWASRPGRARRLGRTHDLLLSILPFEKDWYTTRIPSLRVEFVGHPLVDRHSKDADSVTAADTARLPSSGHEQPRELLLLPGSRESELRRHLPVMVETARLLGVRRPLRIRMVLPSARMATFAQSQVAGLAGIKVQVGGLSAALQQASVALASTGTVTLECAWFGVPTVTLYKTNWLTYTLGKRLVTVPYLTMPNLLAGGEVMPEFVQDAATPAALAGALNRLLDGPLEPVREKLAAVRRSLGSPGASDRAATAILSLLNSGA